VKRLVTWFLLSAVIPAVLTLSAAAQPPSLVIPAGTQISVRISESLSSETAQAGDLFHGSLVEPIVVDQHVVFRAGSEVTGTVLSAHRSGRLSDPGVLELDLTSVSSEGRSADLNVEPVRLKGGSHTTSNASKIGGGAAAGAIIGAIAGGGKGAAIGAGVGAAVGTGVAAATGKKDAKVESESVLTWTTAGDSSAFSGAPARGSAPEPSAPPAASSAPPPSSREDAEDEGNGDWQLFSASDRRTIRTCFQQNESSLPPSVARRDKLPPELDKQLERDGTLPPGLEKQVHPLPDVCENQLGPLPQGAWRGVYSRRVLLIDQDNRILDAFDLDEER
jgi:hypothetical protein